VITGCNDRHRSRCR